jgi:hypothetical protein
MSAHEIQADDTNTLAASSRQAPDGAPCHSPGPQHDTARDQNQTKSAQSNRATSTFTRARLEDLGGLSRQQLAQMWQRAHGCSPPKGVRRGLLERSAAWHVQARSASHLVTLVRAQIKTQMGVNTSRLEQHGQRRAAQPALGTRLVREWNGRTYIVHVTEEGYMLNGRAFRSLTAVARQITGAHWSGPRFFGL